MFVIYSITILLCYVYVCVHKETLLCVWHAALFSSLFSEAFIF